MNIIETNKTAPPALAKLDEEVLQAEAELHEHNKRAEARIAAAQQLRDRLEALMREHENRSADLAFAEATCESFKQQLTHLKETFVNLWTNRAIPGGPGYREIIALEAAVNDFPRVRKQLAERADRARIALQEFERKHFN